MMKRKMIIIIGVLAVLCMIIFFFLGSDTPEAKLPSYDDYALERIADYDEFYINDTDSYISSTSYSFEGGKVWKGGFYSLIPNRGLQVFSHGADDELVIVKGVFAYNFDNGNLHSLKISFEEKDCDLHDLTLSVSGSENQPVVLEDSNDIELILDDEKIKQNKSSPADITIKGILTYEGTDYKFRVRI